MSGEASKIEKKRISILGCGWLGIALAQRLLVDPITSVVKASTTSEGKLADFERRGLEGFLLPLTPGFHAESDVVKDFFNTDSLVISLPPRSGKNEPGFYTKQIEAVVEAVRNSPVKEVIFISSTSIYPDLNRVVTEEDVTLPEHSPAQEMVLAEKLIESLRPERTVSILRFGGLLGYNRIPGKYVQGQKDMSTGEIPVNYIHRDDGAAVILTMLKLGVKNETFNIVAPSHPPRKAVYLDTCGQFGWEAPTFLSPATQPDFKIISNEKFTQNFAYEFLYPDPLRFLYMLEDTV
ncbi:NAD-dependent epimerase/dehydratase family protein [Dyadobacter sp. CY343]|uniref:NAD-dependent epimerase/dehydratase family protein n=1 Tax=Dyadobacter sp. CY343 TaxID=2907299 RepID=UPI001F21667B|nr:NAD-dependent epimerase/dehydratase family protein [Dyadobacter sp. CY343]MCE7062886.1 NAD-dependent dehydratase [Dyadobacter sp. CY343]